MNNYEHLKLAQANEYGERSKGSGRSGISVKKDRNSFITKTITDIDNIIDNSKRIKEKYPDNLEPYSVFRIDLLKGANIKDTEIQLEEKGVRIVEILKSTKNSEGSIFISASQDLEKLKNAISSDLNATRISTNYIDGIENISLISRDEKIGDRLKNNSLSDKLEFVDVELWKEDSSIDEVKNYIEELKNQFSSNHFRITDSIVTKGLALLRIELNKESFEKIVDLSPVMKIERPYFKEYTRSEYNNIDIQSFTFNPPPKNATGILIIDSGIISNHPMLEKTIGDEENFQEGERETQDTTGHGTAVAGSASYGDIKECIDEKIFNSSNFIFSAKVMYAEEDFYGKINPIYDPEKLLENQLLDAVNTFLSNEEYNIKCVNISLGNSDEIYGQKNYKKQFRLAALIDELALKYSKTVFVVSSGNCNPVDDFDDIDELINNYPKYLLENSKYKIINPATSALSLTVGSICNDVEISYDKYSNDKIKRQIGNCNQPSPFTRAGYGINEMIKPELVEYGGDMVLYNEYGKTKEDTTSGKLVLLSNKIDKLLQYECGTSYSAAKVSHLVGMIANKFPDASANYIKNLILSGANYPVDILKEGMNLEENRKLYGYGLSNFERSVYSSNNKVLLWDESSIKVDTFKTYTLDLPEIFFSEKGTKKIIVTLTYNPETRRTRGDSYLGNTLGFYIYHSIDLEDIILKHRKKTDQEKKDNKSILEKYNKYRLTLKNTTEIFSSCHQKLTIEYPKKILINPITLALVNKNKWITDTNKKQDYCISVRFEHENEIELYNMIKNQIQGKVKIKT